jgi:hypothetical protein
LSLQNFCLTETTHCYSILQPVHRAHSEYRKFYNQSTGLIQNTGSWELQHDDLRVKCLRSKVRTGSYWLQGGGASPPDLKNVQQFARELAQHKWAVWYILCQGMHTSVKEWII